MRGPVATQDLAKVRHLTHRPTDGRTITLPPILDLDGQWILYLPVNGRLEEGRVPGLASGGYCAAARADVALDFEFPLGTLIIQHLSFPRLEQALGRIESDVHRCAAILEKYHLMTSLRMGAGIGPQLLVASELEYLVVLLRSFYDLLQGVVKHLASLLHTPGDTHLRVVQRQLPDSFADMVLHANTPSTWQNIVDRYGVPELLARWYESEAPFFLQLRNLRDGIAHFGKNPPTVYALDLGYAIKPDEHPWNQFGVWPQEQRSPQGLGSLRTVFVGFIAHSLSAASRFASVVRQTVQLPPAVLGDLSFFIRNPHGHWLNELTSLLAQPWEGRDGLTAG